MFSRFRLCKVVIFLALCTTSLFSSAQQVTATGDSSVLTNKDENDRILDFHSDIRVSREGNIEISEMITVFNGQGGNANDQIQRGIVRDFPTRYQDARGFWSNTGFKLIAVFKNDRPEEYLTESMTNGIRIKIGNKDILLDKGVYHYRIDYTTNKQLIFHDNKDELYWNVNGNGWSFTADSISCTIEFPTGADISEFACYTGPFGSTASNCISTLLAPNKVSFSGSKKFEAYEGLTVAAAIQKGILYAPGKLDTLISFLGSNYIIPLLGTLLIFLTLFYVRTWLRKGRDPVMGTIYPQFEPPAGLYPADTGYILNQEFGTHLFVATLVDAAVQKELEIEVAKEGLLIKTTTYHLNKTESSKKLTVEKSMERYGCKLTELYGLKIERGQYSSRLKSAQVALEASLKDRFLVSKKNRKVESGLFALNQGYQFAGIAVLFLALILGFTFLINHFSVTTLVFFAAMMLAMVIIHVIFSRIMSAYTKEGRNIADHILGFKMYLQQAEQRFFEKLTPPEKTLDLFEKYLPYAIALNVENEWAEKFDTIIQQAIASGYQPAYFHTHSSFGRSFGMSDMSRSLSSGLTSTISSSSTPPSSSSGGSSGGGSSGGGGGGGGGGGW